MYRISSMSTRLSLGINGYSVKFKRNATCVKYMDVQINQNSVHDWYNDLTEQLGQWLLTMSLY